MWDSVHGSFNLVPHFRHQLPFVDEDRMGDEVLISNWTRVYLAILRISIMQAAKAPTGGTSAPSPSGYLLVLAAGCVLAGLIVQRMSTRRSTKRG